MKYILIIILLLIGFDSLGQKVVGCTSGVVDNNVGNGIKVENKCGELLSPAANVNGNIEVLGNGELRIAANINKVSGNIVVDPGATLIISADINNINGSITNNGTLIITGNITAKGKLEINGNGTVTMDGGSFTSNTDKVVIDDNAKLFMNNASSIDAKDGVENKGTINSDGTGNTIKGGVTGEGHLDDKFDDSNPVYTDAIPPGIVLSSTNGDVCSGDVSTTIAYSEITGGADKYSIDFNNVAEGQGFVDVIRLTLSGGSINITVPEGAAAGVYSATLTVYDVENDKTSEEYAITVTIIQTPKTKRIFRKK
jgi:hypothetical protein